jgi:replicative superfamily II helicase
VVDLNKLRTQKKSAVVIDPIEIFRRLPKPSGINDLYTSQAEVLHGWFARRADKDVVLKLHTGGGKTLVGLLIAQSTLTETKEPVLYLAPTRQLVQQTIEKAKEFGIPVVAYESGQQLNDDFVNARAVMVATYKALFHGKSKFGIRGGSAPTAVGAVILDDAHAAFSVVRESFTLEVESDQDQARYLSLSALFRSAFKDANRLGTFDDVVSGADYAVLEIPYWAWREQLDAVREQLRMDADKYALVWPLLRDQLHLCHALISRRAFTITPILPLVRAFPTFAEAPRRIYMSATIADDSEIIRTFDADQKFVEKPLTSRSLAGISERMILMPDLMQFPYKTIDDSKRLASWTMNNKLGSVILVPSGEAAKLWTDVAALPASSAEVSRVVEDLQAGRTLGPVVFASRYDGIDLPGNACRMLVMSGLPKGTSNYELFRANSLYGGATITRMLAQRIEQGIGRGARGSGDHCVILMVGADLAAWLAKDANFRFLTAATRAQLEMGSTISREVKDLRELAETMKRSYTRETEWVTYHAVTLAELVDEEAADPTRFKQAVVERKALDLWQDGYHEKAISGIEKLLGETASIDDQTRGWMEQFAARVSDSWGNRARAEDFQRQAFAHNRNLTRPSVRPPYVPQPVPGPQEVAIVRQLQEYRLRRGFLKEFEEQVSFLNPNSSASQFEGSLAALGRMIGLTTEQHDTNGEGPDVLWLLPHKVGVVIEAKSRKKPKNPLTKREHGQLLVAAEWFSSNYPGYECVRVSVHPTNKAIPAAEAAGSYALTYEKLNELIADARALLESLCDSQLAPLQLTQDCAARLSKSDLRAERLPARYLASFEEEA